MISAHKMQADSPRRPHLPMISSVVCLCVFMWKDGNARSYGCIAARMGIGNEFANPKFPNCLSRFWYFAELVNCLFALDLQSNRHLPLFLVRHLHALIKNSRLNIILFFLVLWLATFFLKEETWLLTHFINGLHCNFNNLCNWIIFSVFIF